MKVKNLVCAEIRHRLPVVFAALFCAVSGYALPTGIKPQSRDIVPVFETTRPPSVSQSPAVKKPVYKRISSNATSARITNKDRPGKRPPKSTQTNIPESGAEQIGITIWQLWETRPQSGAEIFSENYQGRTRYLVPGRVSIDKIFQPFDMVRFSIESSRRGYLYIIDQEMYADGTSGVAHLIFPSPQIGGGANNVSPGKPVELPDLTGKPFYFTFRPASAGAKSLTAEVLTIIITNQPIAGLAIGDTPQVVSEKTRAAWSAKWAGKLEIFESNGDNSGYTKREREAAGGKATLSGSDPLPQTVFMVENNRRTGTLITVPLWYGK